MLKRFLAAMMCITLLMGTIDLGYAAEVTQDVPATQISDDQVLIKAHFKNSAGWSKVASYFGEGDNWAAIEGYEDHKNSWPGKVVEQDADHPGYHSVEIVKSKSSSLNIIFNNNNNGSQTADLIIPASKFSSGSYEFWTDASSKISEEQPGDWNLSITSPEFTDDGVVFRCFEPTATTVEFVTAMNNWTPQPMTKGADGIWSITLDLDAGTYAYKFLVDGTDWKADSYNSHFSGDNSLCIVPGLILSHVEASRGDDSILPAQMSVITESGAKEDTDVTYTLVTQDENVSFDETSNTLTVGADYAADTVLFKVSTADGETKDLSVAVVNGPLVVSPEVNGATVTFRYKNPNATSVAVAGTMNNWSDTAAKMTKDSETGVWSYTCSLPAGQYQYKFVVDGNWILDSKNTLTSELDGSENSLVIVKGSGVDNNKVTLKLHYINRPDNNYTNWDAWIWTDNMGGNGYEFKVENKERVATVEVDGRSTYAVNYIVRKSDWSDREFSDRSIDISDVVSGTVHYYVESGVEVGTRVLGEDAVLGVKIRKAEYDRAKNRIVVTTALPITGGTKDVFEITRTDGTKLTILKTNYSRVGTEHLYTITIAEDLTSLKEVVKSYTLAYDGYDYPLTMPNIYSSEEFESAYTYDGDDLGATWTAEKTTFKVWAPTADSMNLKLYTSGTAGTNDCIETIAMTLGDKGVWTAEKTGDCNGIYYTYEVTVDGSTVEACDPYARTTGVNGKRAMVINLDATNPADWDSDISPNQDMNYTDAIIYELHVRDLSINEESGISDKNKGEFLGLTETGTKNSTGQSTGLDHIKELGVTHIHLLPVYDYGSVDESKLNQPQFNWGYDPVNYNVPEGSYSSDPYNGTARVKEMKQMVKTLHDNHINVIMDVVYNHVYNAGEFGFNQLVPKYFSRTNADGSYSNGSGCGNDTASERAMVKKYIVDSVNYWADEYHIDGFRFDLVGLIDTETINEVVATVHETHPDIIFYGEGWSMGTAVTKDGYTMATQGNSGKTPGFAYFSDTIRDFLKGGNDETSLGYVSGATSATLENDLANSFMARPWWSNNPSQVVNYASCHDNYTLKDKLNVTCKSTSETNRIKMNNLAAAIYLTSEGIPLIHAGEEMLRTKVDENGTVIHNSYNSSDYVNSLKWGDLSKESYRKVNEYYAGLIEFRKNHAALRLPTAQEVSEHVEYVYGSNKVVMMKIDGNDEVPEEVSDGIVVIFNPNTTSTTIDLYAKGIEQGEWKVCVTGEKAGTDVINTVTNGKVTVSPISTLILVKGETVDTDSVYIKNKYLNDDEIRAEKITLNQTSLELSRGQLARLSATVTPVNAVDKMVSWRSSDSTVVKVTPTGFVIPVGAGTAYITASAGNVSTTCSVTVKAEVESIVLNYTSLVMQVDKTQTLTASVLPAELSDQKLKWSSSDKTVATVTSKGVVTAKKAGTAIITVTAENGVTATCEVTVLDFKVAQGKDTGKLSVGKTQTVFVIRKGGTTDYSRWSYKPERL